MPQGWEGVEEERVVLLGLESLPSHYTETEIYASLNGKPKEKSMGRQGDNVQICWQDRLGICVKEGQHQRCLVWGLRERQGCQMPG